MLEGPYLGPGLWWHVRGLPCLYCPLVPGKQQIRPARCRFSTSLQPGPMKGDQLQCHLQRSGFVSRLAATARYRRLLYRRIQPPGRSCRLGPGQGPCNHVPPRCFDEIHSKEMPIHSKVQNSADDVLRGLVSRWMQLSSSLCLSSGACWGYRTRLQRRWRLPFRSCKLGPGRGTCCAPRPPAALPASTRNFHMSA